MLRCKAALCLVAISNEAPMSPFQLDTLRRQIDRHSNEEQLNHQKFANFEAKLKDLRENISDLQQQQQDTFGTVRKSEDSLYRR